jgi:hypothetical protein
MKKEPDIRPWNEKHKERRKVEGHPCNTVPAEMHTQMINERDKKIAELQSRIGDPMCICHNPPVPTSEHVMPDEPHPTREGWKVRMGWFLFLLGSWLVLIWGYWISPHIHFASPKGTGDAWRQKCQIVWLELGCHDGDQRKICKVLSE